MMNEESIFAEALRMPTPADRAAFLSEACGGDVKLRTAVEALLAAHERTAGGILDAPLPTIDPADADGAAVETVGAMIGPYKLLQQLGEGGMGQVFMAEQSHPVRRTVALKIIKPGMDSRQVIARFEAERQALAMMDHPNIARVFDAGTTDTGRPYFVMELVRGIPITEYCDQHQLSPRQRLELFIPVCQAVQHAHQKGIIHRDLKPTNILITLQDDDTPTPKVIDFGIAKATAGQRLTDHTLFTEFRQLIGTPLYMSPEQAEMSAVMDVDTRSDVYALGVLLYELLTGTTPFDKQRLATAAFDEVRRIIRDEEPPRPSTRLSTLGEALTTVSASRATDPKKLSQTIRGELDWIVMRALEKERSRRYETAIGLARDVERYLADQPVEACPPSGAYRLRKAIRRNKPAIMTAAVVMLVLLAATGISTWQAVRATRADRQTARERDQAILERHRADDQTAIANAVNTFLNEDVLAQASAYNQNGKGLKPDKDLKVRDALERAIKRIGGRFNGQPLVEAAVRHTIADALEGLGDFKRGEEQAQVALGIRRKELGDSHPDTLATMLLLARTYMEQGQFDKAEPLIAKVLETDRTARGEHDPATLEASYVMEVLDYGKGDFAKAESNLRATLDAQRAVLGTDNSKTLDTMDLLGQTYMSLQENSKAEALVREALEDRIKLLGKEHPATVSTAVSLATIYHDQGKHDAAQSILLRALDSSRQAFGANDDRTLDIMEFLGTVYRERNDTVRARIIQEQVLQARRQLRGEHDLATLTSMVSLGAVYLRQREYDKAEPLLLQSLQELRKTRGDRDGNTLLAVFYLTELYLTKGRLNDAESFAVEALRTSQAVHGPEHPDTLSAMQNLGEIYARLGNFDRAEPLFIQALAGRRKVLGELHPNTVDTISTLSNMYLNAGRYSDADRVCRNRLELTRKTVGSDDTNVAAAIYDYGVAKKTEGNYDEADRLMNQALLIRRKAFGNFDDRVATNLVAIGGVRMQEHHYTDAEAAFREAMEIRQRVYKGGSWLLSNAKIFIAEALVPQDKFEEAEQLLLQANSDFKTHPPPASQVGRLRFAINLTAELYEKWGKPEQAAIWRAKLPASQPTSPPASRPAPVPVASSRPSD